METENWINEILNSTNGITQVAPSGDLFSKIQQRIYLKKETVSSKTVWLMAVSIVLLVTINIAAFQNNKTKTSDNSERIIAATLNKSNQLY